jgi:glutathione synthase/RimK-type ligase-like ATP-grasp enzyme
MKPIKIAIGQDSLKWFEKFADAFESKKLSGLPIEYQIINVEANDWVEQLQPFDMLIWKPAYLGSEIVGLFKEKIYFIEKYLGKLVLPNFDTIWHYDSKIAQSYLLKNTDIPTPKTVVSFDYQDACEQLNCTTLPIVVKKSWGAASKNVRLITTEKEAWGYVSNIFFQSLWDQGNKNKGNQVLRYFHNLHRSWFWVKVDEKLSGGRKFSDRFGVVYWQEFIRENSADLRITVIGDRYAYGFWRNNRPNDFRASGSGRLDYERDIPKEAILKCIQISKDLNFDSMAYDLLFKDGAYMINEISYAYLDIACFNANGYYLIDGDDLSYISKHTWPQDLWVEWAFHRAGLN